MKIAILTQPLNSNYGGLLQAYALQMTLKRMGHEVWILDRHFSKPAKIWSILGSLKRLIKRYVFQKNVSVFLPTSEQWKLIRKNTDRFIGDYIYPKTEVLYSTEMLQNEVKKHSFDVFIVGSDQVWRPCYSPHLPTYFLEFAKDLPAVRKVAYAASFGVDNWELTKLQTKQCASLAQLFDAISVREESGIRLCKDYLQVEAAHVLDPTILLEPADYEQLVEVEKEPPNSGDMFVYVLDSDMEKTMLVDTISCLLGLRPFTSMPLRQLSDREEKELDKCVFPPVTQWIRGFMDAKFVVTDSFHGCVFSIIFNKPFITIGNKGRGSTRFDSLLSKFRLQDRLIYSLDDFDEMICTRPIDWESINSIRAEEQKKAMTFLRNNLSV